jgi:hypothetical protein
MSTSSPCFDAYIGIDYSGAGPPDRGLTGLRAYQAQGAGAVTEIRMTDDGKRHWNRRALAEWLAERLSGDERLVIGIDHGFCFPRQWFAQHDRLADWDGFLADFHEHWPTDAPGITVEQVRRGLAGDGLRHTGDAHWRRAAEKAVGAKSVFHFDVPGSVAKSTHAGLPWLHRLRQRFGASVHAWPFDGWQVPAAASLIAEVYPSLWSGGYPRGARTADQHDAYAVAGQLQAADRSGLLRAWLAPPLDAQTAALARQEGWILGVAGDDSAIATPDGLLPPVP